MGEFFDRNRSETKTKTKKERKRNHVQTEINDRFEGSHLLPRS